MEKFFMETSFKKIKSKCVINVTDGKKLGKITDVYFTYPQNCVKGFCVENGVPPFSTAKTDVNVCSVQKIGEDAVFVKLQPSGKNDCGKNGRRDSGGYNEAVFVSKQADDEEEDE